MAHVCYVYHRLFRAQEIGSVQWHTPPCYCSVHSGFPWTQVAICDTLRLVLDVLFKSAQLLRMCRNLILPLCWEISQSIKW